uniref:CS domain-containing protein n=1 Tax=Amorphochlora amoebiformis TaxID=1561963 RepID=A0A7S0GM80_9EUKA|mmetsp:Transcript_10267/g.16191  ORF Transcript_10267/g.16191 Transcript_10267/m.16191 type:complete len:289 (+) Transcript_10267:3-869(+)
MGTSPGNLERATCIIFSCILAGGYADTWKTGDRGKGKGYFTRIQNDFQPKTVFSSAYLLRTALSKLRGGITPKTPINTARGPNKLEIAQSIFSQLSNGPWKNSAEHLDLEEIDYTIPKNINWDPTVHRCFWRHNHTFYWWEELLDEEGFFGFVGVFIPVNESVTGRDVTVKIQSKSIEVKLRGKPILEGKLHAAVRVESTGWELEDVNGIKCIKIGLNKINIHYLWQMCVRGEREIGKGMNIAKGIGPDWSKKWMWSGFNEEGCKGTADPVNCFGPGTGEPEIISEDD